MRHLLTSTALMFWAGAALAQDAALLLGTERYETLGRLSRGTEIIEAADELRGLGFEVFALPNGRAGSTAEIARDWLERVPEANRLVVALSGRFATDGARSWFLTAEAEGPGFKSPGAAALRCAGRATGAAHGHHHELHRARLLSILAAAQRNTARVTQRVAEAISRVVAHRWGAHDGYPRQSLNPPPLQLPVHRARMPQLPLDRAAGVVVVVVARAATVTATTGLDVLQH